MLASFLQTKRWQEFQESLGRRTFFVCGENWEALLIRHELPLGKNYLYCPRGPTAPQGAEFPVPNSQFSNENRNTTVEEFLEKVEETAKQEKSIFFRWDPPFDENFQFSILNFQKLYPIPYTLYPVRSVQPQHSIIIDLAKNDEQLLKDMHEKTRYNIRLAERKGVMVREVPGAAGVDTFWHLLQETSMRDNFSVHPKKHYKKLLDVFSTSLIVNRQSSIVPLVPFARLYVAEYNGLPLAAAIIMFYGNGATYLHGASSNWQREVMAPQLLHWRIIQDAKRMGCTLYDFWGIDDKNPHWAGITRFKRGFGGREISYTDSVDMVFDKLWYGMYELARKFF